MHEMHSARSKGCPGVFKVSLHPGLVHHSSTSHCGQNVQHLQNVGSKDRSPEVCARVCACVCSRRAFGHKNVENEQLSTGRVCQVNAFPHKFEQVLCVGTCNKKQCSRQQCEVPCAGNVIDSSLSSLSSPQGGGLVGGGGWGRG